MKPLKVSKKKKLEKEICSWFFYVLLCDLNLSSSSLLYGEKCLSYYTDVVSTVFLILNGFNYVCWKVVYLSETPLRWYCRRAFNTINSKHVTGDLLRHNQIRKS